VQHLWSVPCTAQCGCEVLSTPKELRVLIQEAEAQGWEVTRAKTNHFRWRSPQGDCVFSSSTPSDWRVVMKITKDLRKYGFNERKK
jgi:predicted RNA binding protein YcfA (HicA-like mRNA interferase family)